MTPSSIAVTIPLAFPPATCKDSAFPRVHHRLCPQGLFADCLFSSAPSPDYRPKELRTGVLPLLYPHPQAQLSHKRCYTPFGQWTTRANQQEATIDEAAGWIHLIRSLQTWPPLSPKTTSNSFPLNGSWGLPSGQLTATLSTSLQSWAVLWSAGGSCLPPR